MAKLGEVCKVSASTKMIDKSKAWLLNLDMVEQQTGRVVEYNFVGEDGLNGSITQFDTENVLYSKLRPNLNKVVLPERNGFCTSELLPLRPDARKLDRSYLAVFLRSDGFVNWAVSKTAGAKMPRLGTKDLLNANIPLPEIKEQKAIAEEFKKSEELISLRKQQLVKLDELVKARFVEMFDAISPKKCASKIGECAEVLGGYAFKSDCFSNQGVPVVRIGNINDGRIDIDYNTCYAEEFWNKNPRFQARKYDILMAMSGATTGKVGIYKSDERLLINQRVACIRARDDESAIFLFACLQLPWMYNLVQEASAGCAQPNISGKQIETMPVPKPETSKVHQFAAFVERVDQQKQTIQQSLEKLELMKKVLMQEYFG